jgi:hypothetical protein
MKLSLSALALVFILTTTVSAHDGHNHGPGQVQPTKGGVIMKGEKFYLEVVGTNKQVKFYPTQQQDAKSMILKPIPLKDVKLVATLSLPRGKKNEAINLVQHGDHFMGDIDAKGSHRYQVDISIETMGEKEKISYQIEPQE